MGKNKSSLSIHRSKQLSSEHYKFQHAPLQAGARVLPTAPAGSSRSLWPGSIAFHHVVRSAPAHTLRSWGSCGVRRHRPRRKSTVPPGALLLYAPAASLWALCDSDMEEFDSKDISTSKDEDCVPLGERLYLRRTAACPAQRLA